MMQTKLKVGFNRASRIIDELEQVGIVGPQDPRNPVDPENNDSIANGANDNASGSTVVLELARYFRQYQ